MTEEAEERGERRCADNILLYASRYEGLFPANCGGGRYTIVKGLKCSSSVHERACHNARVHHTLDHRLDAPTSEYSPCMLFNIRQFSKLSIADKFRVYWFLECDVP